MPYGKECHIEAPSVRLEMRFDHTGSIGHQRRVAGKKAGNLFSIEKIHIGGTTPSVNAIAIAFVSGRRGVHLDASSVYRIARTDRSSLVIPAPSQPLRN